MVGEKLSVTATAANGNEFDSEATDPVRADKAGVFELVDDNGFQVDGTALPTDTLRISYGADLGTPQNITWYHDGAIMAVYSLNNGNLTQGAFNSDACRSKKPAVVGGVNVYQELALGTWMATIENTEGELWTSNEVEVALTDIAIMSDVSIEDDYETTNPAPVVDLDKETDSAIINVTFNKDYKGDLYLINSKYEKDLTGTRIANTVNFAGGIKAALDEAKSLATLTNKKATADGTGAYYEDATGALHCKIVVELAAGQTVTRGDSYYLVWDQDDLDVDDLTAKSTKDTLNVSDDMVVPYVKAPASLKISSFASGATAVKVDALDEDGDKLAWYTVAAGDIKNLGLSGAKIFKIDTYAKSDSDSKVNVDDATAFVKEGTYTFAPDGGGTIDNAYVYVKLTTVAGVFDKDPLTLESEISESARKAVESISLAEDTTDPTAAVVKFKGLSTKAPGTVYIMQGDAGDNSEAVSGAAGDEDDDEDAYALIAGHDLTDAVASAKVEGGAASVTIPNIFSWDQMQAAGTAIGNDAFVAVFVPDDTDLWMRADSRSKIKDAGGDEYLHGFRLTPVITTIDKEKMTATLAGDAGSTATTATAAVINIAGIQIKDQFGKDWVGSDRNKDTAKVDMIATTATNNEVAATVAGTTTTTKSVADVDGATGTISFDVTVKFDAATNKFDKGDGIKITVANLKGMTVTITAKDTLTAGAAKISDSTAPTAKVCGDGSDLDTATDGTLKLSDIFSIS